jgi:catechol 2,3-dioxygenase-like lactoylglutathione lyase family enzyme
MPTTGMNHFTVLTDDVAATVDFYRDLVGLIEGPRPPLGFPGAWLYTGGQAVLHVVGGRRKASFAGVIDHGFSASGLRHDCDARPRRQSTIPAAEGLGRVQSSCDNGARVELDFSAGGRRRSEGPPRAAPNSAPSGAASGVSGGAESPRTAAGSARPPRRRRNPRRRHRVLGNHGRCAAARRSVWAHNAACACPATFPRDLDRPPGDERAPRWFELDNIALQAGSRAARLITGSPTDRDRAPHNKRGFARQHPDGARHYRCDRYRRRPASSQRHRSHADRVGRPTASGGFARSRTYRSPDWLRRIRPTATASTRRARRVLPTCGRDARLAAVRIVPRSAPRASNSATSADSRPAAA